MWAHIRYGPPCMMGCISSRSFSSRGRELRLNESDGGHDENTSKVSEVKHHMGGRDVYESEGDMRDGILMSRNEIDQSSGDLGQMSGLFTSTTVRQEMSRDQSAASLKRKRKLGNGSAILAPFGQEASRRIGPPGTTSKTNQLTAFILLLIQRRKRRLSSRIEVGDFIASTLPTINNQKDSERTQDAQRSNRKDDTIGPAVMDNTRSQSEDTSRSASSHLDHSQRLQRADSIEDDPILLFTSVEQLCHEIVNRKLVSQARHAQQMANSKSPPMGPLGRVQNGTCRSNHHNSSGILCLFVFGLQGSSMGELSFELVQHSSLIHFIQNSSRERKNFHNESDDEELKQQASTVEGQNRQASHEHDCPLYHYIDVSALIVANIDQRIAVYNRLVGQALRSRYNQVDGNPANGCDNPKQDTDPERGEQWPICDSISSDSQDEVREDEESNKLRTRKELDTDSASLWSAREPSIISEISIRLKSFSPSESKRSASACYDLDYGCPERDQTNHVDQFGMVTLSTRQRSMLQLKLAKYATCVTAKWITILIHNEISRFEKQLHRSASTRSRNKLHRVPTRVYLINLVPNQLSLFKTCLYLHQELALRNFRHPFLAVKFERRTNIKVIIKERNLDQGNSKHASELEVDRNSPQHQLGKENNNSQRLLRMIKFPQIRLLPAYLITRSQSEPNVCETKPSDWRCLLSDDAPVKPNDHTRRSLQIEAAASDLFASGANQKLGPRVSENFANQFNLINRLTRIRYNPTENLNYASNSDSSSNRVGVERLVTGAMEIYNSCHGKLNQQLMESRQCGSQPASPLTSPIALQSPMNSQPPPTLFVALDNPIRPESAASEDPNTIPDYLNLGREQDHLDPRCLAPPSSSPMSSLSNDSSELSGAVSLGSQSPHHYASNSSVVSNSTGFPKWAIELELIDEHDSINNNDKWYSKPLPNTSETPVASGSSSDSQAVDPRHETPAPFPINCCLHIYLPPARRSSSRSPLSLVSAGKGRASSRSNDRWATSHHPGHYYLVYTPVAYATGRSQPILEAKTVHKRTIRYSSGRSDSARLLKVLARAQIQLVNDLDSWLKDSLNSFQTHAALNEHQTRHHASQHHRTTISTLPHLVTYTIKVNVTKLLKRLSKTNFDHEIETNARGPVATNDQSTCGELEHVQLSRNDLAHLLQMKPERPALSKRAASASPNYAERDRFASSSRILSSRSTLQVPAPTESTQTVPSGRHSAEDVAVSKPRHVQFKLNRPPEHDESNAEDSRTHHINSQAQTRVWVKDSLFVSCYNKKLVPTIDLLIRELLGTGEMGAGDSSTQPTS